MSNLSVLCVIQARMSSLRLPGKVLLDLGGHTILHLLHTRLRLSKSISQIVIATSTNPEDDAIEQFAKAHDIFVFRGALNDVASRFVAVAEIFSQECILRVCADSPFYDAQLVDDAAISFAESGCDILTSCNPRTTPHGLSIEMFKSKVFLKGYPQFESDLDREHVTRYFYNHRDRYDIFSFNAGLKSRSTTVLAVDTVEDFARAKSLYQHFGNRIETVPASEIIEALEHIA